MDPYLTYFKILLFKILLLLLLNNDADGDEDELYEELMKLAE